MAESVDGRQFQFAGRAGLLAVAQGTTAVLVGVLAVMVLGAPPAATTHPGDPPSPPVPERLSPRLGNLAAPECVMTDDAFPEPCRKVRPWPLDQLPDPGSEVLRSTTRLLDDALDEPLPEVPWSEVWRPGAPPTTCSLLPNEQLCLGWLGLGTDRYAHYGPELEQARALSLSGTETVGGLTAQEWVDLWIAWLGSGSWQVTTTSSREAVVTRARYALTLRQAAGLPPVPAARVEAALQRYPAIARKRWNHARALAVKESQRIARDNRAAQETYELTVAGHEKWLGQVVERNQRARAAAARLHRGNVQLLVVAGMMLGMLVLLVRRRRQPAVVRLDQGYLHIDAQRWAWRDVASVDVSKDRIVVASRDGGTVQSKPLLLEGPEAAELKRDLEHMLLPEEEAAAEERQLRRARAQRAGFERG